MKKPELSTILATYNQSKYIKQSIDSILNQTFENFELIIIDDSSTDKTQKVIKEFKDNRIKLHKNKTRLGLTKSLNKAISYSKGHYIARMDADDVSEKNRFQVQINYLKKHSEIMTVGSWAIIINKNGKTIGYKKMPTSIKNIRKVIPRYNPFIHPSLVFRREIFKKVGRYDEQFRYAQDYDLMLRITSKYKTANIPNYLLKYREHDETISSEMMGVQLKYAFKARKKALKNDDLKFWESIYLIKPFLSLLIPTSIKKSILEITK